MALVSDGFDLVVTLKDNGGNASNLRYKLEAGDAATATTATASILTLLNAVTNAVVSGYSIIQRFVEDALTLPGAGVHIEDRAKVVCNIDGNPSKTETIYIPAPVIGLFQGTSGVGADTIDPTDTALLAYLDIWQVTGPLANISDGEFLTDNAVVRQGNRTHRGSSFG